MYKLSLFLFHLPPFPFLSFLSLSLPFSPFCLTPFPPLLSSP